MLAVYELIHKLVGSKFLPIYLNDPRFAFGMDAMNAYKLAPLLPTMVMDSNVIVEEMVRSLSIVADDGDPNSPPQMKSRVKGIGINYQLGHVDISMQMTSRTLKHINNLMVQNDRAVAESYIAGWMNRNIRQALERKAEIQRCDALTKGQVTITRRDGSNQIVSFPRKPENIISVPSGTNAARTGFYDDSLDPIAEFLFPQKQRMEENGYQLRSLIMSSKLAYLIQGNRRVRENSGGLIVNNVGNLETTLNQASLANVNAQLNAAGIPNVMTYDNIYHLQDGSSHRYFPDNVILMVARTNREQELFYEDEDRVLKTLLINDTLGYTGVGISEGETQPGMVINTKSSDMKPKGITIEGYREQFPVWLDFDAVTAIEVPALA